MPKSLPEMNAPEREMNRKRIAQGIPCDWECDKYGKQTPESRARDAARIEAVRERGNAAIARQFGLTERAP